MGLGSPFSKSNLNTSASQDLYKSRDFYRLLSEAQSKSHVLTVDEAIDDHGTAYASWQGLEYKALLSASVRSVLAAFPNVIQKA